MLDAFDQPQAMSKSHALIERDVRRLRYVGPIHSSGTRKLRLTEIPAPEMNFTKFIAASTSRGSC